MGIDDADWTFRAPMFRALRTTERGPEMSFGPKDESDTWQEVRDAWRRLPPHPNALEVTELGDEMWLRYAALEWNKLTLSPVGVLSAGIALTNLFQHVRTSMKAHDYRWFTNPVWFIDVFDQIRIGWLPVWQRSDNTISPPELRKLWPMVPERTMVFLIGSILYRIHADAPILPHHDERRVRLAALLARATDPRPEKRMPSLAQLETGLRFLLKPDVLPISKARSSIEEGIGWLQAGLRSDAALRFAAAVAEDPMSELARKGLAASQGASLADLGHAKQLEAEGRYSDAIEAYRFARPQMDPAELYATLARCSIALKRMDDALRFVNRAVELAPLDATALELKVTLALVLGHIEDARVAATRLVAVAPERATTNLRKIAAALLPSGRSAWSGAPDRLRFLHARTVSEQLLEISPPDGLEMLLEVAHRAADSTLGIGDALPICMRAYELDARSGIEALDRLARRVLASLQPSQVATFAEAIRANPVRVPTNAAAFDVYRKLHELRPELGGRILGELAGRMIELSPATKRIDLTVVLCDWLVVAIPEYAAQAFERGIESAFRGGAIAEALLFADRLLELSPESAVAHYRRGRCLFALKRYPEARDALERACKLDPKLIEAMHLRREVDRAVNQLRAVVGTPHTQGLTIPAHLPAVREAMSAGQIDEAIRLLEAHDRNDADAQYLLGQLLVGQDRHADAIAAFDRVTGSLADVARVGKARAMAAIGRGEEALRLLDRVVAEQPDLGEAYVVRTSVIHMLRAT